MRCKDSIKRVVKRLTVQAIQVSARLVRDWMRRKEPLHWVPWRVGKWHFWTAFSFRGPRKWPSDSKTSSPGTRCFRVAARTARFTCPEFYCTPTPSVDSMTARDLNTVGPCRLFSGFFFSFFKFPETRNSSHSPLCIFTISGDIILIRAISFFLWIRFVEIFAFRFCMRREKE